jgi:hypothetical protein
VFEEPSPVLGEAGGIEGRVLQVEVHEPLEEEVVLQAFAELALAADRVERHQERRLEEVLGRDGGPADDGIHLAEDRREFLEDGLHQGPDAADGMTLRDFLVGRDGRERCLPVRRTTHLGTPP